MNRTKQKRKTTKDNESKRRKTRGPAPPPTIDLNITHRELMNYDATNVSKILSHTNPDQVALALNALMRATSDVDANYCLGYGGEKVIAMLVQIFDDAIEFDANDEEDEDNDGEELNNTNLEPTVATWDGSSLNGKHKRWRKLCREKLASPLVSSSDPNLLLSESSIKTLDIIVFIFRNLSYVGQNLRFLYHSDGALRVLTGALYYRGYSSGGGGNEERSGDETYSSLNASSSHNSNMCIHALQTLINIAPLIDITGKQLFIDRVFLESDAKEVIHSVPEQQLPPADESGEDGTDSNVNTSEKNGEQRAKYGASTYLGFGGMYLSKQYDSKAETLNNIPNSVVWDAVGYQVRALLAIFPALSAILDPEDVTTMNTSSSGWHRPSVQAVLELLTVLVENPDNKGVFLCTPDVMLHRLTDMLFMPRLGPESMEYVEPESNTVTRVVALKLQMTYDATIDCDMRDRSCDLLIRLTDLSTGLKRKLGMASSMSGMARRKNDALLSESILSDESSSSRRMNVRLYDSLLPMISSVSLKGDAGAAAVRLLSNLAQVPENKAGILYVERKLIRKAGSDPHIAKLACNGVFDRL
jgi:hypothetical protein